MSKLPVYSRLIHHCALYLVLQSMHKMLKVPCSAKHCVVCVQMNYLTSNGKACRIHTADEGYNHDKTKNQKIISNFRIFEFFFRDTLLGVFLGTFSGAFSGTSSGNSLRDSLFEGFFKDDEMHRGNIF